MGEEQRESVGTPAPAPSKETPPDAQPDASVYRETLGWGKETTSTRLFVISELSARRRRVDLEILFFFPHWK